MYIYVYMQVGIRTGMFLVRITPTKVCTTVHADEGVSVKCVYGCGSVQVSGVQMGCVDVGCSGEDMQSGVCTQQFSPNLQKERRVKQHWHHLLL